jgi:hypothetical protein
LSLNAPNSWVTNKGKKRRLFSNDNDVDIRCETPLSFRCALAVPFRHGKVLFSSSPNSRVIL